MGDRLPRLGVPPHQRVADVLVDDMPMRSVCMCGSCVEVSLARATTTRPRGAAVAGPAAATTRTTRNARRTRADMARVIHERRAPSCYTAPTSTYRPGGGP